MDDATPRFLQIAEQIEGQIVDGSMHEESQVPSMWVCRAAIGLYVFFGSVLFVAVAVACAVFGYVMMRKATPCA